MKRGMIAVLAMVSLGALLMGGCANKETVKSEEQPAATVKQGGDTGATAKTETPKAETPPAETKPTPEPPKVDQSGTGSKFSQAAQTLESVYFDFDKSDLRQDTRDVLTKNADVLMKSTPQAKVRIEGNCDERGSAEYNIALGERRAKSVMQYLITLGVPANRLSTISYGKEKATADAKDESVWSKDRRADFVVAK